MNPLTSLGWNASWQDALSALQKPDWTAARVCAEHKEIYEVHTGAGVIPARIRGAMQWRTDNNDQWPTVGDWIALSLHDAGRVGRIEAVLPRRSVLRRKVGQGEMLGAQAVASNIDTVFVVTSLNRDFNPRRLERALALVWESGAQPVVVLSKSDLCGDTEERERCLEAAHGVALGVAVHIVSATEGDGLDALFPYLGEGRTLALIGSSGVGKSTLTNALLGEERQLVHTVRADDDRGRHTTTGRHLLALPGGGCLIDTPGIRTVGLWDADEGVASVFADIEELATTCRFRDCTHTNEPGCAVIATVDPDRLASYKKLQREVAFQERRENKAAMANTKRRWKAITKANRKASRDR